jgi:Na+/alanine symporter
MHSPSIIHEDYKKPKRCRRVRHRMVVGFTSIYAISVYHHQCCDFESYSDNVYSLCDKVCQWFVSGRWFFLGIPFLPSIKLMPLVWNEIGLYKAPQITLNLYPLIMVFVFNVQKGTSYRTKLIRLFLQTDSNEDNKDKEIPIT